MALQALSLNYYVYARGDGLLFPLQLIPTTAVNLPERLYHIMTVSLEIVSVIFLAEAIFGRMHKRERFALAVLSSLFFVAIRVLNGTE